MKKTFFLVLAISLSLVFGSYSEGQTVTISDQNIEFDMCAGYNPDSNDQSTFKLADLNGDLNGGAYHVTWIDMAATW